MNAKDRLQQMKAVMQGKHTVARPTIESLTDAQGRVDELRKYFNVVELPSLLEVNRIIEPSIQLDLRSYIEQHFELLSTKANDDRNTLLSNLATLRSAIELINEPKAFELINQAFRQIKKLPHSGKPKLSEIREFQRLLYSGQVKFSRK